MWMIDMTQVALKALMLLIALILSASVGWAQDDDDGDDPTDVGEKAPMCWCVNNPCTIVSETEILRADVATSQTPNGGVNFAFKWTQTFTIDPFAQTGDCHLVQNSDLLQSDPVTVAQMLDMMVNANLAGATHFIGHKGTDRNNYGAHVAAEFSPSANQTNYHGNKFVDHPEVTGRSSSPSFSFWMRFEVFVAEKQDVLVKVGMAGSADGTSTYLDDAPAWPPRFAPARQGGPVLPIPPGFENFLTRPR